MRVRSIHFGASLLQPWGIMHVESVLFLVFVKACLRERERVSLSLSVCVTQLLAWSSVPWA